MSNAQATQEEETRLNVKMELVAFETSNHYFYVKVEGKYVGTIGIADLPDRVARAVLEGVE